MRNTYPVTIGILLAAAALQAADRFVSLSGPGSDGKFLTWETAASNIQQAMDVAAHGDVIYIAPGVYTAKENSKTAESATTTNVVHNSSKFVSLIGATGNRDDVIIDGEGKNRCYLAYANTSSERPPLVLQHLTLRNGRASQGAGVWISSGQSPWVQDSIVEMRDCAVISNTASSYGGGLWVRGSAYQNTALLISNCLFSANMVTNNTLTNSNYSGGAIRFFNKSVSSNSLTRIVDSVVEDNWAPTAGGIYHYAGALDIRNTEFHRNKSAVYLNVASAGGALQTTAYSTELYLTGCLFANNFCANNLGGGVNMQTTLRDNIVELRNCTFWGNVGNGFMQRSHSKSPCPDIHIWNSIFYNNTPNDVQQSNPFPVTNYFYNSSFTTTNLNLNVVAVDLVEGDPRLVDPENGDFRLRGSSHAVGTGMYQSWMDDAADLAGNPRITPGSGVDMGAYAFRPTGALFLVR